MDGETPGPPAPSGRSGPLAGLERWLADARARDAAEGRVRERWLRQQADEGAELRATLLDLAEHGIDVVAVAASGDRHVGRIEAVGFDFVAVRASAGRRLTLLALERLAFVRASTPAAGAGRGDDEGGHVEPWAGVALVDVLGHAAAGRPRVQLRMAGATVTGELRAVGVDVATVVADGDPPGIVYARVASVSEVSLLDSG